MSDKPLIMVIEDSRLYRQQLIHLCEANDYQTITEDNGIKAIETLYSIHPDLILLDIQLPGMDGYTVCEHIRQIPAVSQIPVIFLTSSTSDEDIIKGFESGGNDYVTKPFNSVILLSRIKTQLEHVFTRRRLNEYILNQEKINTLLQRQKEKLEFLASRDQMTGLFNRHYIQSMIAADTMSGRHNYCLALFDIDDFKIINDTYGHDAGDIVLREFADIMTDCISQGTQLGRWGGEEFLLYLPDSDIEEATDVVDHIRQRLDSHLFTSDNMTIHATVTCGLSAYRNSEAYEHIFNRIDKALYMGKERGKNCIVTL